MKAPNGGGLHLDDVLDIEDRYRQEYDDFQSHFRRILDSLHPGDDTHALRLALKEVDEGIRALDACYEKSLKRQRRAAFGLGSGALAVMLYSAGADVNALVTAAMASSSLSSCVEYLPDLGRFPHGIRESPFFILWLIRREGG